MHKIKTILLVLFLFLTSSVLAQKLIGKGDVVIHISSLADFGQRYYLDIYKNNNSIKITYKVFDSVANTALNADPRMEIARKEYKQYNPYDASTDWATKKLVSLYDYYSVYERDSVTINIAKNIDYNNLLNRIAIASKAELEQEALNKNREINNKVNFGFTIKTIAGTKHASAQNPVPNTHPLLFNLLSQSFRIGRENKLKLLSTKKFAGYNAL